jgi:O-antigen ligase
LVGLKVNFQYVPLVIAGFLVGKQPDKIREWIAGLAILGGLASAVGVVQGALGSGFLAPEAPTPGLDQLSVVRSVADSGAVVRPSGTFVSTGRFGNMALVVLALCLSALLIKQRRRRSWVVALASLAAIGAVWTSGGRTLILYSVVLVMVGLVGPLLSARRGAVKRAAVTAFSVIAAIALIAALYPPLFTSRAIWYQQTLDPRSSNFEIRNRSESAIENTVRGVQLGGLFGRGTGSQSLGRQYLGDADVQSLEAVEGGYAAVAAEWGWIGLALWLIWTITWVARQWRCVRAARGTNLDLMGMMLVAWTFFFLFFGFFGGIQGFQDYLPNAYFWLFSGFIFALPTAAKAIRSGQSEMAMNAA